MILPSQPPPVRDLEAESAYVGPLTRMILVQAGPEGEVAYRFGKRRHHSISLPRQFAGASLLLLDSTRWAMLLSPQSRRLEALILFVGMTNRVILFGSDWGRWINEHGETRTAISVPELMLQWDLPLTMYEERQTIALEFPVNIFNREVFTPGTLQAFREVTLRHVLEFQFSYPLGGFRKARIKAEDEHTERIVQVVEIAGFPLILPSPKPAAAPKTDKVNGRPVAAAGQPAQAAPGAQAKPAAPPPKPATAAGISSQAANASTASRQSAGPRPAPNAPGATEKKPPVPPQPAAGSAGPYSMRRPQGKDDTVRRPLPARPAQPPRHEEHAPQPPPRTEIMPVREMLTVIGFEHDPVRRWKMIEANLLLSRPERTYPLIARYGEQIGEETAAWPPVRLKTVFTHQPGSVLIGLMQRWTVNQVLAVAEENGEAEKITEWLREREIERLLKLNLEKELISAESARQALHVDRNADEAAIKKVWRTLLGYMNADHGRREERPIHRKKDEIAKHLQVARNILLKQR